MNRRAVLAISMFMLLLAARDSVACSTCFGDPDSQMVKGAVMGVYVMIGVVGCVLAGFTGAGIFWIRRSRQISAPSDPSSTSEGS